MPCTTGTTKKTNHFSKLQKFPSEMKNTSSKLQMSPQKEISKCHIFPPDIVLVYPQSTSNRYLRWFPAPCPLVHGRVVWWFAVSLRQGTSITDILQTITYCAISCYSSFSLRWTMDTLTAYRNCCCIQTCMIFVCN